MLRTNRKKVEIALKEFAGNVFDISNCDYRELTAAINEEIMCRNVAEVATGSLVEIISDLNDSIGLAEFGITE